MPLAGCFRPSFWSNSLNCPRSPAASSDSALVAEGKIEFRKVYEAGRPSHDVFELLGVLAEPSGVHNRLPAKGAAVEALADAEDVLVRQRLEEEQVARVVVGAHRLRIRVHHD